MKRILGDTGLPLYNVLSPIGIPPIQLLVGRSNNDISIHFIDMSDKTKRIGDGVVTITDAPNGKFTYTFSVSDLKILGTYRYFVVVSTPGGNVHYKPQILEVINE